MFRSYNSKANSISSDGRRHSIGNFLLKDRFRSGSFSDEVPKIHAPKVPSARAQHYKYGMLITFYLLIRYLCTNIFHIRHNLNNLFKLKTTFKLLTSSLSLKYRLYGN